MKILQQKVSQQTITKQATLTIYHTRQFSVKLFAIKLTNNNKARHE